MRAAFFAPILLSLALALDYGGSFGLSAAASYLSPPGIFALEPIYAGELRASDSWGNVRLSLALYPSWLPAVNDFDWGLSELKLTYDQSRFSLGVGFSTWPLSEARLLRPFALTPPRSGYEAGLPGAWAVFFPDPNTSLTAAAVWLDGRALGLMTVRSVLAGIDLSAHAALAAAPAPLDFAAAASGRLGGFVIYLESGFQPRLSRPWRFLAGTSFYLAGGLATVEAGYFGAWRAAAAYSRELAEDLTLDLRGVLSRRLGVSRPQVNVALTYAGSNGDLIIGLGYARLPGKRDLWQPSLSVRSYF